MVLNNVKCECLSCADLSSFMCLLLGYFNGLIATNDIEKKDIQDVFHLVSLVKQQLQE